jgi:hypothetical protein
MPHEAYTEPDPDDVEQRLRVLEYRFGRLKRAIADARDLAGQAVQDTLLFRGLFPAGGVGAPSTCAMTIKVAVRGCASLWLGSATVNVKDGGGTVVATGTTSGSDLSGGVGSAYNLLLSPTLAAGAYTLEVVHSRFVTHTQSVTLACGANTLTAGTLTPATGYHCSGCCAEPLADTLHGTISGGGTLTATYSSADGGWTTTKSVTVNTSVSSCTLCDFALNQVATWFLRIPEVGCAFQVAFRRCGGASACSGTFVRDSGGPPANPWPSVTGADFVLSSGSPASITCPPSFSMVTAATGFGTITWIE